MKGGAVFYRGKAIPVQVTMDENDVRFLVKLFRIGQSEAMMFRKYSV
jgi:hypothetical protein